MGPWDNMFSLAEAARLKQDGHLVREPKTHSFDFATDDTPGGPRKKRKRNNTRTGMSEDEFLEMKRALPMQRGNQVHAFKDAIELGICSLDKGRELFDLCAKLHRLLSMLIGIALWRAVWCTCRAMTRKWTHLTGEWDLSSG